MTDLLGGDHLWPGPVSTEVDGWKCFILNSNVGQDYQHYRQSYGGGSHQLCGGGHVHIHDGDVDGLISGPAQSVQKLMVGNVSSSTTLVGRTINTTDRLTVAGAISCVV